MSKTLCAKTSQMASVYDQTRGRRAVVVGVGLPGHRVRARAVVVCARRRRRRQNNRCFGGSRRGKPIHRARVQLGVGGRDRPVRRAVEAQRRRRRLRVAVIAYPTPKSEGAAWTTVEGLSASGNAGVAEQSHASELSTKL